MLQLSDLPEPLRRALGRVELVVSDVDGVLTDGTILLDASGGEARAFNMKDGLGVKLLRSAGVLVAWLSAARDTGVVRARAAGLGVDIVDVDHGDKGPRFQALCEALQTPPERSLYLGDDVNDLPAMELAGLAACPADAVPQVRRAVDLVLSLEGGRGAFREAAELVLQARAERG